MVSDCNWFIALRVGLKALDLPFIDEYGYEA